MVSPTHLLRKDEWIDLFKDRRHDMKADRQPNAGGNGYSKFMWGCIKAEENEKHPNSSLSSDLKGRRAAKRIDSLRRSVVEHILNLEDGILARLTHRDAIARYRASSMIFNYYWLDECLHCPKWLEMSKTDVGVDELLRHLVTLFVSLREPVPAGLRDWASAALLVDRSKQPGRRKKNWRRDQKITLAVEVLVGSTSSSVASAPNIVADVCREQGIIDTDPEGIKKIRDRVKQDVKRGEVAAFP